MHNRSANELLLSAHISVRFGDKPPVLRDVELEIHKGEVLGLVGQSGSGKSTLAMAILGLLDRGKVRVEGSIQFEGVDLLRLRKKEIRALRGRKISLVLQSPISSLNPALRIRRQLKEAWQAHASTQTTECEGEIRTTLKNVCLPSSDEFLARFPSQMSVGQAQRVLIAMAVIHRPALLIADEATSALDVITQAEILDLFRELNRTTGMSLLYISHDLASVAGICDRIAILDAGRIVEYGITAQVLTDPQHAYTRKLMAAMPRMPLPQSAQQGRAAAANRD